ncbi:TPA: thermonuclease family protein [Neisseria meningitidis]
MKKLTITTLLFSVATPLIARPLPSTIDPLAIHAAIKGIKAISCRPISISDGDTFTCLTADKEQMRIRMNSIDAPEKAQAYGRKAKQALSSLIFGKTVSVVVKSKDRYGRFIADVIADGHSANKSMVLSGYAWVYREYVPAAERAEYLKLEAEAKNARRGLWADPNPIYPSQFRHKQKAASMKAEIAREEQAKQGWIENLESEERFQKIKTIIFTGLSVTLISFICLGIRLIFKP